MSNPLAFTVSDDAIPLTAGAAKFTWRMPLAMTPVYVRGSLTVAQASGAKLTVDIKKAGVSIFSTSLTFDNGKKTTVNAVVPAVLLGTAFAMDDEFTVDTSVGDGTAKGLKLTIYDDISGIVFPPPDDPPPPPTQTWQTIAAPSLTSNTGAVQGYDYRFALLKAAFAGIVNPTKIRVTVRGLSNAVSTVAKFYAGPAVTAPNASALTQITFGGNPGVNIPTNAQVLSDEVAFVLDPAHDLMLNFEPTTPVFGAAGAAGWARYAKAVSGESDDLTVTSYFAYNSQILITKVEVFANAP